MDIRVSDVVDLKKPHPCSSKSFEVLRVGMDIKLKCLGCSREMMLPRAKVEKSVRLIRRGGEEIKP